MCIYREKEIEREREREIFQMTECLRMLAIWFVRNVGASCDIERSILSQIEKIVSFVLKKTGNH